MVFVCLHDILIWKCLDNNGYTLEKIILFSKAHNILLCFQGLGSICLFQRHRLCQLAFSHGFWSQWLETPFSTAQLSSSSVKKNIQSKSKDICIPSYLRKLQKLPQHFALVWPSILNKYILWWKIRNVLDPYLKSLKFSIRGYLSRNRKENYK